MIRPPRDAITLTPFVEELRRYKWSWLRLDLQAGASVALFAVPQVMAYAMLAGLPPVHGLYAAAVMAIVAALLGSSPYINSGPSNSASLLAASALLPLAVPGQLDSTLALVFQFTLLVGLLRVLFGVLRLGHLVRFIPESATLGFVTGAGILIGLGQLHHFLGVPASQHSNTLVRVWDVLSRGAQANPHAVAIGVGTLIAYALFDRFSKRFPVALAVIALATVAATALHWPVARVQDIARIPAGLPPFQMYALNFARFSDMLVPALAVAVIGLIEAVSIGQTLALRKNQDFQVNQEFFGQGIGQIVAAFFGGLPGSGSFSRSALVEQCGGQTRLANVCFGVLMGSSLLFAPGLLEMIPTSALAGLLLYSGFKLVSPKDLRRVWRTDQTDAGVLALTFFVTVFVKVELGFFAGATAAMVVFLSRARQLRLYEVVPQHSINPETGGALEWKERPYLPDSTHPKSDVVAISLHGDLFFGLAQSLREQLKEIVEVQEPKFIVIRMRRVTSIDYSCWSALFDFSAAFTARGGRVYLSGTRPELKRLISKAGMEQTLPETQLIVQHEAPWQAFQNALASVRKQLPGGAELSEEWRGYFGMEQQECQAAHQK